MCSDTPRVEAVLSALHSVGRRVLNPEAASSVSRRELVDSAPVAFISTVCDISESTSGIRSSTNRPQAYCAMRSDCHGHSCSRCSASLLGVRYGLLIGAIAAVLNVVPVEIGRSRIPVYIESVDRPVGVVIIKDLLRCAAMGEPPVLSRLTHELLFAPETARISLLLREFSEPGRTWPSSSTNTAPSWGL